MLTLHASSGALILAAQHGNSNAVEILAQVVDEPQTFTAAFKQMTSTGTLWLDVNYFDLVALLLARGNADENFHAALISALLYVLDGIASEELLQLLLEHGADVNFDNGTALQVAAHNRKLDLFEMLLQKSPNCNSHSLYMALQAALSNGLEEETAFGFFNSVTDGKYARTQPEVNNYSELGVPLIFYCLIHYPTSARLVKQVCDLNADLDVTINWDMYEDKFDDPVSDRLSPLLLSLEKDCSDDVIGALMNYGGESTELRVPSIIN